MNPATFNYIIEQLEQLDEVLAADPFNASALVQRAALMHQLEEGI